MVARCIQRKRRGKGPEAAFGKASKEGIGLKVKGGSFAVRLRPDFRKPGNIELVGDSVRDRVLGIGGGEVDDGFRGGVINHFKFCSRW